MYMSVLMVLLEVSIPHLDLHVHDLKSAQFDFTYS